MISVIVSHSEVDEAMSDRAQTAAPRAESRPLLRLQADCASCFGLCCVAHAFGASADFAIDKAAGQPCPNLRTDFRCGIHTTLRPAGFKGCAAYDCFGAGQHVAQGTYAGVGWREAPETAAQMFDVFAVMRQLHELLWHLTQAREMPAATPLRAEVVAALNQTARLTQGAPEALLALDLAEHRHRVHALLARASELVRADVVRARTRAVPRPIRAGADLVGAQLREADLRGADLRGALLIAADLTGADLRAADLIGADLRDADLSGTDLSTSLFLTQSQLDSATGDERTRVPSALKPPNHWPGPAIDLGVEDGN